MAGRAFYFDPEAEGSAVFMGRAEACVMEIVWRERAVTVKQVLALWEAPRVPAYTTVMTLLTRLTRKSLLQRRKRDRNFVYSPAVDRATFLFERVTQVKTCLARNFSERS